MTMARVMVSVVPCSGVSVIFAVSFKRWWRRSAALPLALRGTAKATVPAFTDERTSRPTRVCFECPALASDARAVNRATSMCPPELAWVISIDPRTVDPCWLLESLSAVEPAWGGRPEGWFVVVRVVVVVVEGVVVVLVGGVVLVLVFSTAISYLV